MLWHIFQHCYSFPVLLLVSSPSSWNGDFCIKKKTEQAKSALCTNCIFRSWCIDPHNSHGSVILHSIYNMLQLWNPQHIFPDIKEERKLWKDTGQKQTGIAAQTGHCHLDCAVCFETHQRKSEFCLKNHNMTSIPSRSPGLAVPERKGKCGFSEVLFHSKKIYTLWTRVRNTYSRSISKTLMFGSRPFCLTLLRCQVALRDWQVYSWGGVSWEIGVFAV